MIVKAFKTRVFAEGEGLVAFIKEHVPFLAEKSILIVTSKIVALAEKRTVEIKDKDTKRRIILKESEIAIPTKYVWLTLKDGMIMASAGIDESNAQGKLILLPRDSYKSARSIRNALRRHYKIKDLGIILTDSRTAMLRAGVTGVSIGYAGIKGIRDYRDTLDIFGRPFKFSRTNIADSLATAAVLLMGEGNEQQPLALIQNAPVKFCERIKKHELEIPYEDDMYGPLFKKISPPKTQNQK